jgi:hypothetical protein
MAEIEYVVRLWVRGKDFDPDTISDLLERRSEQYGLRTLPGCVLH